VPDGNAAVAITLWHKPQDMLKQSYEALRTSVFQSLALQTRLKPYLDEIGLNITDSGIQLDFTQVKADFTAKIEANPASGIADLMDFATGTGQMLANSGWNGVDVIVDYLGTHLLTAEPQAALVGNGKSWRWRDGERNAFGKVANDAVFQMRMAG
jgi:hypothetical protein